MFKNIIILILAVIIAFLFISKNPDRELNIQENNESVSEQIKQISNEVIKKNSNSLDLSGQKLDQLPSYVLSMTELDELDISNNELTGALPAEIRHLENLRILKASNNNMTGVPAEIGQLEKLETLDLSNNQLTGLPYELGNLKNLKILNISGNNYAKQDLEVIKEGLSKDVEIIL